MSNEYDYQSPTANATFTFLDSLAQQEKDRRALENQNYQRSQDAIKTKLLQDQSASTIADQASQAELRRQEAARAAAQAQQTTDKEARLAAAEKDKQQNLNDLIDAYVSPPGETPELQASNRQKAGIGLFKIHGIDPTSLDHLMGNDKGDFDFHTVGDTLYATNKKDGKATKVGTGQKLEDANGGEAGAAAADVKDAVQGMMDGIVPPQLPGRASKEYTAMMAESKRRGYNLAEAAMDWTATQRKLQTLNGNKVTGLMSSITTAGKSLDVIDELTKQWDAGKLPALNSLQLKAAKQGLLGPQAATIATQLEGQITDVVSELGNVYMGGNSPTDYALQLAGKNLSADWSKKTLMDMTNLARKNLQIRRNSIATSAVEGASPNNPYDRRQPDQGGGAPVRRFNPATGQVE